jgi:uncharacterized protein YjbI with pentapeptide repeats
MVRDEAIKLLKGGAEGIVEWNRRRADALWNRLRGGREGLPNLSKANLSGAYLRDANLSEADLSEADLGAADLTTAVLSGANLRGANLSEATLGEAILDEANLSGASLSDADLSGTFFSRADLRGADLIQANLYGANLRGADLRGAYLISADLSKANLCEAYLSEVHFNGANLCQANLSGADVSRALCIGTVFTSVDRSDVRGIDSIQHLGPSIVGIDTLFRSRGRVPEAFLRGCGVPDQLINYLPSIIGSTDPIQFYSCFISYSSKDHDFVERLHADLLAKGVRCWFDNKDLKIGDKIRDRISEAIRVHDKLMLVLSEQSIDSDWVEGEVEAALERERTEKRAVLFPIRLDDAVVDTSKAWASHIRQTRHIGDFQGWQTPGSYQAAFARLLRDLKADEFTEAKPG